MSPVSEIATAHAAESPSETVRGRLGNRAIVLVGLMGAGKSSIGKRLAAKLGLPFTDVDNEIESAANCTIAEIFARYGEEHFREGEKRVLMRLLDGSPKVLATGGGTYLNPESRAAIRRHAISVWLKADLPVLLARVRRRNNRPLIRNGDPEGTMRRLMEERYPVYAEADIQVTSRDVAHETVAAELIEALADHLGRRSGTDAKP